MKNKHGVIILVSVFCVFRSGDFCASGVGGVPEGSIPAARETKAKVWRKLSVEIAYLVSKVTVPSSHPPTCQPVSEAISLRPERPPGIANRFLSLNSLIEL